jgi:hypothetical protein
MGKYLGNRLHPFEWVGSIAWSIFWGVLGYVAISERSITLGGRNGITHPEGLSAVLLGFLLIGASLVGVSWLLRLHAFKRLLQALLFGGWLCSAAVYLWLFYP